MKKKRRSFVRRTVPVTITHNPQVRLGDVSFQFILYCGILKLF